MWLWIALAELPFALYGAFAIWVQIAENMQGDV